MIHRAVSDYRQNVFEPLLGIKVIDFAACKEAVEHSGSSGTFMRAGEQIVFSSQGNRSDGVFDQVVVVVQISIVQVILQAFPQWNRVFQGLTKRRFWKNHLFLNIQPLS